MSPQTPFSNEIKAIKDSALFQLSLGSKELFHSNFIALQADKYKEQMGKLFATYLKNQSGDLTITKVVREQKNIDIHLYFANGQELIIENKVKSIPYLEQLEKYTKGHAQNQNFLLLTLTRPEFSKSSPIKVLDTCWHVMSYSELAVLLANVAPDPKKKYSQLILEDYISFITALSTIFESVGVTEKDMFNFETDETFKLLKENRIGDLYSKLKFQSFSRLIAERLRNTIPNTTVQLGEFTKKRERGIIYVSYGMSRAQGLLEVSYEIEAGLYLTLQLQGSAYRQMVQGYAGYGKASKNYATKLKESKQWFDFSSFGNNLKIYPNQEKKTFNKYGETDFYQSVKLGADSSLKHIIDIMVIDIKKALALTK